MNAPALALPPGWWQLPPHDADGSVQALVDRTLPEDTQPALRDEVGAEWRRLARIAGAGGAVLLAGGAAVDPASGRVVTASLLVAPYEAGGERSGEEGPRHALRLPAGPAIRRTRLARAATPVGDVVELCVDYEVAGAWVLAFRTPALGHVPALLAVFDAIAASLHPQESTEPAFL
jgi:hypothetical protein